MIDTARRQVPRSYGVKNHCLHHHALHTKLKQKQCMF